MPIQFACIHCDQRLSVSQKKIGSQVQCPQCKTPIEVPDEATASEILENRRRRREAGEENPFSQFAVFDEEPEIVYEHELESVAAVSRPTQEGTVDPHRLAVPRLVLYMQGGLLAAVALVAFTFGILVGGVMGPSSPSVPAETGPHTVNGALYFQGNGQEKPPDSGALVMILPLDAKPEPKPPIEGIRLEDPQPKPDNPALMSLRQIGADYARTSEEGKFQLQVPRGGKYYLLFISQERTRSEKQSLNPAMLARLGGYVQNASDLIGNHAYQWREERLQSDRTLTHVFE